MRILIIVLCLLAGSSCAAPVNQSKIHAQSDAETRALTALIKKHLPPGWVVAHKGERGYSRIHITRLEPTAIRERIWPSSPHTWSNKKSQKPEPLPQYDYFLSIGELVPLAEYKRRKAANEANEKQRGKLAAGLRAAGVKWNKVGPIPRNDKERRRVEQYRELQRPRFDLPDYYWGQISLSKIDLMEIPQYDLVIDDKVREECKRVTLKVLGLLTPYEKAISSSAKAKN